jgi:hypothetical protein
MASLLDIGPLTEEVEVRGVSLTVHGLTAGHLFQLFAEFPDMRKMLKKEIGSSPQEMMLALAPDLIAKIIAMVTGDAHNKEAEAKAKEIGASDQLSIMAAVQRLSFPEGIGPFVERVTGLMTSASTRAIIPVSMDSSDSMIKSPARFSASLQTDIPAGMHGHSRRVN